MALVERAPRKVMLTPAGREAAARARGIVAEVEQAAGAAEEHAEPAAGAADASVEPAVDAADTGMEPMMDATVAGEEPAAHLSATSVTESAAAPLASPRAEEAFSGAIDTHATE